MAGDSGRAPWRRYSASQDLQGQEIAMPNEGETSIVSIAYEGTTGTVTVTFDGRAHVLPERYRTHAEGMRAGNDFCRRKGWPCRS
jgi:hypothetical protein